MQTTVTLNTGAPMPRFGLGVFRAGEDTSEAVQTALKIGYRHLDTAAIYKNEEGVGKGLRASGLARQDVFITTKLWNSDHGYDSALRAFDASLKRLGMDYVDLYLIHWPVPTKRKESWRALERLFEDGRAKAIGVSNYMIPHLQEVFAHGNVKPACNQFELHPFIGRTREPVCRFCEDNDIAVMSYSPLTKGKRLGDPRLAAIAAEVGKTPAQVLIRWVIDKGRCTIPKSSNPQRIAENAAVFDFSLTPAQLAALDDLEDGGVVAWDPMGEP